MQPPSRHGADAAAEEVIDHYPGFTVQYYGIITTFKTMDRLGQAFWGLASAVSLKPGKMLTCVSTSLEFNKVARKCIQRYSLIRTLPNRGWLKAVITPQKSLALILLLQHQPATVPETPSSRDALQRQHARHMFRIWEISADLLCRVQIL